MLHDFPTQHFSITLISLLLYYLRPWCMRIHRSICPAVVFYVIRRIHNKPFMHVFLSAAVNVLFHDTNEPPPKYVELMDVLKLSNISNQAFAKDDAVGFLTLNCIYFTCANAVYCTSIATRPIWKVRGRDD